MKRRRPPPASAGKITSCSSSTRSAASSDCVSAMLPCTPIAPPVCVFRSRTKSTASVPTTVEPAQSIAGGDEVNTYFGTLLMKSAKGWMSAVGQYPAHSSYERRPSNTVSCSPMTRPRFAEQSSSKAGTKLPGPSATPSTDSRGYGTRSRMQIAPRRGLPGRALASLALVHRGDARDRDLVALLEDRRGHGLGFRHVLRPGIAARESVDGRVDREVGRRHRVEVVPAHGEGDGHAGSDARAVRGNDRRTSDAGG